MTDDPIAVTETMVDGLNHNVRAREGLEPFTYYVARFTTTPYDNASVKHVFFLQFTRWLAAGCDRAEFVKRPTPKASPPMYEALMQHLFGHIAEFTEHGFYGAWFSTPQQRARWVQYARNGGAFGLHDIRRTDCWGDVERAVLAWLRESGVGDELIVAGRTQTEIEERAQLAALKAKYPED